MIKAQPNHITLNSTRTLLIGIGNSGRRDDGLAWFFLDAIKEMESYKGEVVYRYQLQVEDAELISQYDQVIFVDAWRAKRQKTYSWEVCKPESSFEFTTHALSPGTVLSLCKELYGKEPCAYVLKIRGAKWGLGLGLSEEGRANMKKVLDFYKHKFAQVAIS